jgi:hypothetical protein
MHASIKPRATRLDAAARALALLVLLSTPAMEVGAAGQDAAVRFLGLEGTVPASWSQEPPASSMRVAQLAIPGDPPAQLAVFYFGPRGGGPADANIARWRSQFSGPGGAPVEPVISEIESLGGKAVLAEFEGTYARGVGMGPVGEPKPDQMLLAAIVESPRGKLFFQLHGPAATVGPNRAHFVELVTGLRPSAP